MCLICIGQDFPLRINQFDRGAMQIGPHESHGRGEESWSIALLRPQPSSPALAFGRVCQGADSEHLEPGRFDQSER